MPSQGTPVRVVIDPSGHDLLNLGDVAMLQVAVVRLHELWPDAVVHVLTNSPERLAQYCPRARALPAAGRYGWNATGRNGGGQGRAALAAVRSRAPGRVSARVETALRGLDGSVSAYIDELSRAHLFLVAGRGGTTDAFASESLALLDEIETAMSLGARVAMTGQGIGPMREPRLIEEAGRVLPRMDLIALREGFYSKPILESLGVPAERIVVTGDDALEPAFRRRPHSRAGGGIGLGLRIADYAGVDVGIADGIGRALRGAARELRTRIVPLPISHYPGEVDGERASTLAERFLAAAAGSSAGSVEEAIARVGGCRVAVTGSYHAAVFAVAQGIPTVAFWRSPYYLAKFEGLRDQFDGRVRVVPVTGRLFEERLRHAIDDAWHAPDDERTRLLECTERQIASGEAVYRRLAAVIAAGGPAAEARVQAP
jgi:polysaccharide pyruvyl transferase WcaK-like protein